jgi:hypothetical protein
MIGWNYDGKGVKIGGGRGAKPFPGAKPPYSACDTIALRILDK